MQQPQQDQAPQRSSWLASSASSVWSSTLSLLLRLEAPLLRLSSWLDARVSGGSQPRSGEARRPSDVPGTFGAWMPNQGGGSCSECGANRGPNPEGHVCAESAFLAHQQSKWAAEIRSKLEPDLQDFLASNQGRFVTWLIDNKRL